MPHASDRLLTHLKAFAAPRSDPRTDRELLAAFAAGRDEPAFAALVRRHGPMVLAACRRILRDRQDAEDACQAVFVLLARTLGKDSSEASPNRSIFEEAGVVALAAYVLVAALAWALSPTAVAFVWLAPVDPACAFAPIAVVPAVPVLMPAVAEKPTAVALPDAPSALVLAPIAVAPSLIADAWEPKAAEFEPAATNAPTAVPLGSAREL